jgi:predicted hydrolase (HD superfamily)
MKQKLNIGLLYLGLHNQLVKKYGVNTIITRKEFYCKLGKHYMIPKDLRHYITKEMIMKKLLELVNRNEIKICACNIDIEKEPNKLYKFLNFNL